jgi:hypothetical protein
MPNDPTELPAMPCSPFAVLNLKRLKIISCADKNAVQDAIRALRARDIEYVAMRWHASAATYVKMDVHE